MKKTKGFTLIEMLIVIAVLTILVMVALPTYQNQVLKGNRAVAKAKLLELAAKEEQFFADYKVYESTLDRFLNLGTVDVGVDDNYNWVATASTDSIYTLSVVTSSIGVVANMAFTLTATPVNGQTRDAASCATLTLNQSGLRAATGLLGQDCWD